MNLIVGILIVFVCVFGGYTIAGGKMDIILHAAPHELLTIFGSAIGAYVIGNPAKVIKKTLKGFGQAAKGPSKKKKHYIELLCILFQIFKLVKSKGLLAIESHVENPKESSLFAQFPTFMQDHHATEFLCDYLRLWTLGTENPHEMEAILDKELETHHHEAAGVAHALQNMADALPALGIVAAVLGVIKTMASISEPPEVLGAMIGGALVGTFLGVFLAYGLVGPISRNLENVANAESKYYECIKAAILGHMQGYAAQISIEFARKTLTSDVRPSFYEVEKVLGELPTVT